ncbi:MAG: NTP transferase domain-containing protein [Clostridia bacterium]|nr:NTP transferase domain-containing protein [Clostridia bacterium]
MRPILVVMAAGMGSRFGGMKQIAPVGPHGEIILDYACFDAIRAGYEKIVFVIKRENEALFRETAGDRIARKAEVVYAFQDMALPGGFPVPEGRVKPWGTGHAVLSAADFLDAPFTVTNADDYYGPAAYRLMAEHLRGGSGEAAMVGYALKNTVTENGSVSRGVCERDREGYLVRVTEKTRIEKRQEGIVSVEEDGEKLLDPETVVSMNFWGFDPASLDSFRESFERFLREKLPGNPLKAEFYLPTAAQELIDGGKARVKVLTSPDAWHGVTYREDREEVARALSGMHEAGLYPERLF